MNIQQQLLFDSCWIYVLVGGCLYICGLRMCADLTTPAYFTVSGHRVGRLVGEGGQTLTALICLGSCSGEGLAGRTAAATGSLDLLAISKMLSSFAVSGWVGQLCLALAEKRGAPKDLEVALLSLLSSWPPGLARPWLLQAKWAGLCASIYMSSHNVRWLTTTVFLAISDRLACWRSGNRYWSCYYPPWQLLLLHTLVLPMDRDYPAGLIWLALTPCWWDTGGQQGPRQWPEVSDFVARFCTLRESKITRTSENRTRAILVRVGTIPNKISVGLQWSLSLLPWLSTR